MPDPRYLLSIQERPQLAAAARVLELAQRLGLDLAYALARDRELLADLFEGVVGVHADAEAHPEYALLGRPSINFAGKMSTYFRDLGCAFHSFALQFKYRIAAVAIPVSSTDWSQTMTDDQEFREFQEWKQRQTQTTEATGKGWKLLMLIGGVLSVGSIGWIGLCFQVDRDGILSFSDTLLTIAIALLFVGLGTLVVGKLGAWWYHG